MVVAVGFELLGLGGLSGGVFGWVGGEGAAVADVHAVAAAVAEEHVVGAGFGPNVAAFAVDDLELFVFGVFFFEQFLLHEFLEVGLACIYPGAEPDGTHADDGTADATLDLTGEHVVVGFAELFGVGFDEDVGAVFEAVLLVAGEGGGELFFKTEDGVEGQVAFEDGLPGFVEDTVHVSGFANVVVVVFGEEFGEAGFPESVDAALACQLAVVVFGGVEGDVGVGDVVADVGGEFHDAGEVTCFEGVAEVVVGVLDVPRHDAVGHEGVFGELFDGVFPLTGDVVEGVGAVVVDVDVVAGGLTLYGVAAAVGIYGVLCEVVNVLFVEVEHLWGEGEDGHAVDALVCPKAPCFGGVRDDPQKNRKGWNGEATCEFSHRLDILILKESKIQIHLKRCLPQFVQKNMWFFINSDIFPNLPCTNTL